MECVRESDSGAESVGGCERVAEPVPCCDFDFDPEAAIDGVDWCDRVVDPDPSGDFVLESESGAERVRGCERVGVDELW